MQVGLKKSCHYCRKIVDALLIASLLGQFIWIFLVSKSFLRSNFNSPWSYFLAKKYNHKISNSNEIIIILENKKVISWTIQAIVFPSTLSSSNLLYTYITHRCLDITSQWGVDWQTFSEEIAKQSRSTRRKKRLRKRNLLKKPFFCSSNQHPHSTKRESQMWQSLCKAAKGSYLLPKGCQYRRQQCRSTRIWCVSNRF